MEKTNTIQAGERTQYTPGPWSAREGRNDQFVIEAPGTTEGAICQVATVYETTVLVSQDERRGHDARLIAAAPELLEALGDCVTVPGALAERSHEFALRRLKSITETARAAIAKATLALIVGATICATAQASQPVVDAKETDLIAYERHNDRILDLDKPMYRCGEIVRLDGTLQFAVVTDYKWQRNHWGYRVTLVEVAKR